MKRYYKIRREVDGRYLSSKDTYQFSDQIDPIVNFSTREKAENQILYYQKYSHFYGSQSLSIKEFWELEGQEDYKPVMLPNDPILCDYLEERGYKEAADILRGKEEPETPKEDLPIYLLYTPPTDPWAPFIEILPRWELTTLRRFGGIIP